MGTLVEEIIGNRVGRRVAAGDTVVAPVDCAFAHDVTAPLAIEAFERMEMPLHDPQRVVLVFDHVMPAATVAAAELHQRIRRFAADHAVRNLFAEGICHIVMVERGYARPGGIVVGADSHSTTYGGLGCFSTGMGSTDVGVILATGRTWFRVPETLRVEVSGELAQPLTAKDVALHVLGRIGGDGADYMAVEWGGETVERMTLDQRLTLANLSADMGAKAGLCEVDATTVRGIGGDDGVPIARPRSPRYVDTVHVDVTGLQPQVAVPPAADNVHGVTDVAGTPIDEVYVGSCTNGRLEDIEVTAAYLSGRTVHPDTRMVVVPASRRIYTEALRRGWIETIIEAGALVMNPGCGPCLGRQHGVVAAGERVMSTSNRNYPGRMGSPDAEIYLASPAVAAATAVAGRIADPRRAH
ncbi:MAG TPA: 3-isopropylmalate dehydratase large subunit [Candidatus Dormibacteraeota bacterium]|nr:3-isopropylmalate dehydratase large subunit [Candidatus Dormibacteraeota bacterium]